MRHFQAIVTVRQSQEGKGAKSKKRNAALTIPDLLDRIARTLEEHRKPEWIDIHQLRAWRAGNLIHTDLHLVLPKELSIEQAHKEAKAVEEVLIDHFQDKAGVLVHMDLCDERFCLACRNGTCLWRKATFASAPAWDGQHMTCSLKES